MNFNIRWRTLEICRRLLTASTYFIICQRNPGASHHWQQCLHARGDCLGKYPTWWVDYFSFTSSEKNISFIPDWLSPKKGESNSRKQQILSCIFYFFVTKSLNYPNTLNITTFDLVWTWKFVRLVRLVIYYKFDKHVYCYCFFSQVTSLKSQKIEVFVQCGMNSIQRSSRIDHSQQKENRISFKQKMLSFGVIVVPLQI